MRPIRYYVAIRDAAKARGDIGIARTITADLARLGYVDPVPPTEAGQVEDETPGKRRPGRPRKIETTRYLAPERVVEEVE